MPTAASADDRSKSALRRMLGWNSAQRRVQELARHIGARRPVAAARAWRLGRMDGLGESSTTLHLSATRSCSSGAAEVLFERTGCVQKVVLNRPAKFNALNLDMVRQIKPMYDEWVEPGKADVCVLMTGAGDKAFCAGGDVAYIRSDTLEGAGQARHDFFFEEYQLNHRIATAFERTGLVQVAVWDGVTMGGGVGLSLHGRIRVATERTLFAMPETALGLFPDVGGTFALSRLKAGRPVGVYMALTGARLGAADCLWSGLATHYVPRENAALLGARLEALGPDAARLDKVEQVLADLGAGATPPTEGKAAPILEPNREGIESCFRFETVEEIVKALQAYKADNEVTAKHKAAWASSTLETLARCSPVSLKVTLRAVLAHAEPAATIGSALQGEYRVVQRMCEPGGDFFEGVRAILVDKDNAPRWSHKSAADVPVALVDTYFAPLPASHPRGELKLD